jgi:uncharacterized protein with HEPN domain
MPRDNAYLLDILDSVHLVLSYISGISQDQFLQSTQIQDSVIRRLEIIGEAARRVSNEGRLVNPALPWKQMIGMRNVVIHGYDEVDLNVVWDTVKNDLPPLAAMLETMVRPETE